MIRTHWVTVEGDFNWKLVQDNFSESYHVPFVHPGYQIRDGIFGLSTASLIFTPKAIAGCSCRAPGRPHSRQGRRE